MEDNKKTSMILAFENKQQYIVPDWVYEQSRFLETKCERGKRYKVETLFPNQPKLYQLDVWRVMNGEKGIQVIEMFKQMSSFMELWEKLDFYESIGTFIEPKRFIIKKSHPTFEKMLIGIQKYALSNQPYTKEMLDETIRHNDWRWLRWGLRYIDLHDIEPPHDTNSFQIAIDSHATECIDVLMDINVDYDNFEEFISTRFGIDIFEEMPASDLLQILHSKHSLQ